MTNPLETLDEMARNRPKRELLSREPLLGDRIESALTSIGVTKDRWAWFVGQFGTPPLGGCGACDHRQEILNDADLWMRHAASELGSAAVNAISKVWAPVQWLKQKDQTQSRNTPE